MHCQRSSPPITTQKALHTKVTQDDIFLGLEGRESGYLSLLMEMENSILFSHSCHRNNLATSPGNMQSYLVIPSSRPIVYPPIVPSSTLATTPHPNPSIPLVTSSRPRQAPEGREQRDIVSLLLFLWEKNNIMGELDVSSIFAFFLLGTKG